MGLLKEAILKQAAKSDTRTPIIPGFLDVQYKVEQETPPNGLTVAKNKFLGRPTTVRRHEEFEAIPQLGAYAGLGAAGAVGGAGLGALVSDKGNRGVGALTGAAIGMVAAPALLALARQQGMLKLQTTSDVKF